MTIDERLDWLISIEKCSDNLVSSDVRLMVAQQAIKIKELYWQELDEKIRLIDDMKYIVGIIEKGTGEPIKYNVAIKRQLLEYVKQLETKAQAYDDSRKAMKGAK